MKEAAAVPLVRRYRSPVGWLLWGLGVVCFLVAAYSEYRSDNGTAGWLVPLGLASFAVSVRG